MPGSLYLVPAPLDFGTDTSVPLSDVLPDATLRVAARLGHWVTENARSTRAFLNRVHATHPLAQPLQALAIQELPREVHKKGDHVAGAYDARPLLAAAVEGHDIGLASEAGMPAVADPGASVVRAAHALRIPVVPLVGPVSLLLALAASGLNGQNFAFVGYLPQQPGPRTQRLRELEALAFRTGQTQLFIETPYRNPALWQAITEGLRPDTTVAVASGLTLPMASVHSRKVAAWKKGRVPVTADRPAVFLLGP